MAIKLLATMLGLSLTACVIGDQGTGNNDNGIIGGTDDAGDPSVVQLRYTVVTAQGTGMGGCTATVIAPTVLLSAAHCVPPGSFNFQYNPAQTADTFDPNGAGWISALSAVANPAYSGDPANGGHDVSIVQIQATTLPVSALGAAPAVGSSVHAVGYGFNQPASSGPAGGGSKRQIDITVSAVTDREFVAGVDGQGTCHGDSGGPIFQNGQVVGTTSYGTTADCHGADHFMRVDDNLDFLGQFLNAGGGGGGDEAACIQACNGDVTCIQNCLGG